MPPVVFQTANMSWIRSRADDGGLVSHCRDTVGQWRRTTSHVDRNLPVQASTKYELIVNLKTAKALGLLLSSLLEAHTGRALVDYGRTMRSPFRANWSRRRVFDVQKKSNPRGDCVRMFWNSPSECVAIGHKTASPARECCTSWTSCSGPYSIRCANDKY